MEGRCSGSTRRKCHGFILTDEGERLRVDQDGFAPGTALTDRCRGVRVSFDRTEAQFDEARAVNVALVPDIVARRARSRGYR